MGGVGENKGSEEWELASWFHGRRYVWVAMWVVIRILDSVINRLGGKETPPFKSRCLCPDSCRVDKGGGF